MTQVRLIIVLAGAAVLAATLVAASLLSAGEANTSTPAPAASDLFAGVPQDGLAVGDPDAPVTLVEYADLQCPYCAEWAVRTMPALVEDYVRTGQLRIVFHGLAFLGPDSDKAVRAAIAASAGDRLWNMVDGFYRSQGSENSGWVTDDLIDQIAAQAGLDGGEGIDQVSEAFFQGIEAAFGAVDGVPGGPGVGGDDDGAGVGLQGEGGEVVGGKG